MKFNRAFFIIGLTLSLLIAPLQLSAQGGGKVVDQGGSGKVVDNGGTCEGANCKTNNFKLDIKIKNPLKVSTVKDAVALLVNAIVRLAIPVIVIFFLWSGLSFIFARGNPEKIREAKRMFFYTIIGTLLILGAWTITNAIIGTVNTLAS